MVSLAQHPIWRGWNMTLRGDQDNLASRLRSCHVLYYFNEVSRECIYISAFLICQPPSVHPSIYLFIHRLPSPRLVNAFCDEVCWKSVLKLLPVFKRVVDLRVRHAAALEPAVKHLCDPPQHTLTAP